MTTTILDAMDHPKLFGPHFQGPSWQAWRAFLAALFALPMDDEALELYRRHTGRTEAPVVPFTEAALICGRRGGKSRILATIAVFLATMVEHKTDLAPGEIPTVAIIASDRKQARAIFRYVRGLIIAVDVLRPLLVAESADSITLSNGIIIEVHTASFRSVRGYTLVACLVDEIAFVAVDETAANPDEEILNAVRPGLGTMNGLLLYGSSPYAKRGVLYKAFREDYGKDESETLVWKAATLEMYPGFDKKIVAKAFVDDEARASAEYGANFRDDIAGYVTREIVDACVEFGCFERAKNSAIAKRYFAFIDASGGQGGDSMTCAIGHMEGAVAVLDALRERRPPFAPDDVVLEFTGLIKSYGISTAESDRWGGDWVGQAFRKHGITVTPSAKPKSDIYKELLPLLSSGRCSLIDNPRLVAQLCSLERRTARGGRDSIDHAPGKHDDLANAAAGVLVMLGTARAPMVITAADLAASRVVGVGSPAWHRMRGY